MRGTCDSCGYKDTPIEEYGSNFGDAFNRLGRRPRFCEVCSSTLISQVETNPEALKNPIAFYRSFARLANLILDSLHELKTGHRR